MSESDQTIDHDEWNYSPKRNPRSSVIKIGKVNGVQPFGGKRNPLRQSANSHRGAMIYVVPANDFRPKLGLFESAAEMACAHELLVCPQIYDLDCQPMTVTYKSKDGASRDYTHDLLASFRNGARRLLFVRNGTSLQRYETWEDINSIKEASKKKGVNDFAVVNADLYTRQRRENLFRMHNFVFQPDHEADEIVEHTAKRLRTLWSVNDLFEPAGIAAPRTLQSVYRLVARRVLIANLDHVPCEHSRIEAVAT